MAELKPKKVVIIGAGFGGMRVAKSLRRANVEVTVIDRENHHLFQPLLYQVATAGLSPINIAMPIRSVLRKQKNTRVLLGEVTRIDKDAQRVYLENGESVPYDYLVIAAGTKTNYFGNDEWSEHAHGLKTIRDAIRIRERVLMMFEMAERESDPAVRKQLLTFVVIGGGPTGVELAGSLAELGRSILARDFRNICPSDLRVILLEMMDRVLAHFDPKLSASARRQLEELGVEVRTGARVTNVDEMGVEIGEAERIPAQVVLWAPGVRPVSLAETVGAPLDRGRIVVDDQCRVPNHPEIFAIGDIAAFVPKDEKSALPQLAPVAMQQGRFVGKVIAREAGGELEESAFRYRDKGIMATVGRSRGVVEAGKLKITGFVAWVAWLLVHVMYLIGFRNRMIVLFEWTWAYLTFRRGARIITARYATPPEMQHEITDGADPLRVPLPSTNAVLLPEGTQEGPAARVLRPSRGRVAEAQDRDRGDGSPRRFPSP